MGLEVQSGLGEILNNSVMKQFHSHPNLNRLRSKYGFKIDESKTENLKKIQNETNTKIFNINNCLQ